MKTFNSLLLIVVIGLSCIVCLEGMEINNLQERIALVESANYSIGQELQETEERCARMTDTCIDILTNKRW